MNQKKKFDRIGIDTLRIARRFLAGLESKSLGSLCEYYQIQLQAHRALNDALATHELYQRLVKDFAEKEAELFQPKELVYSVKKEGPITPKQYELLLKPVMNVTTENTDLKRLTKNEASRLIDKLLSTFG